MSAYDPQALVLFAEIIQHGSFANAARALDMPTTTLSRKIQQLEQQLNGRLMLRSTRSLSLTELGNEILPHARLMRETLTKVAYASEKVSEEPSGRLAISCSRAFALYVVTDWIAAFRQRFPRVDISLHISNRYSDMFASGLDFAFRVGPLEASSLIARQVFESRYRLAASPQFMKRYAPIRLPGQLVNLPCIQAEIDGRSYPWTLYLGEQKFEYHPQGVIRTDDLNVIVRLAEQHQGLVYLPEIVLKNHLDSGRLVEVLAEWQATMRPIYLVYPKRDHLPNKSRAFIDFVVNAAVANAK